MYTYSLSDLGRVQVLSVENLLSEYGNKEIIADLQNRIDQGFSTFVVDLSSVDYMNSVGLNFLLTLQSRSKDKGGQIAMANVSDKVIQLLEVTKLRPYFQVTNSVDDAVKLLEQEIDTVH